MRWQLYAGFALIAIVLVSRTDAGEPKHTNKSELRVKASATATKPTPNGAQTVAVTLDIDKSFHLYANPVNNEIFEANQTRISFGGTVRPTSYEVKYPPGKTVGVKDVKWDVYQGIVKIQINVKLCRRRHRSA